MIFIGILVYSFISMDINTQPETVYYTNGDFYLDHDLNDIVPVPGVDPATGTITCGAADADSFAECGKGKWPAYNQLLRLAQIVALISAVFALIINIIATIKGKRISCGLLYVAAIGAFVILPSPSLMSIADGFLANGVRNAVYADLPITPLVRETYKLIPVSVVLGGLFALIPATVTSAIILYNKLSSL